MPEFYWSLCEFPRIWFLIFKNHWHNSKSSRYIFRSLCIECCWIEHCQSRQNGQESHLDVRIFYCLQFQHHNAYLHEYTHHNIQIEIKFSIISQFGNNCEWICRNDFHTIDLLNADLSTSFYMEIQSTHSKRIQLEEIEKIFLNWPCCTSRSSSPLSIDFPKLFARMEATKAEVRPSADSIDCELPGSEPTETSWPSTS